ncbi:MAG: bifunctional glutamate N-acetyltransferase/amino-acid acetyltransferase ArgJ [Victivallales bacterium]|nr:bifunctional glutamate N-acetyltransferase/amino-acid acetyltransferase ArgJ [Victivallales bacterium]
MGKNKFSFITGGSVTTPQGFVASGITAGLKISGKPDLAMVASTVPANFAGAFTSCKFAAAPVQLDRERVRHQDRVRAVIVNSGNANACTGSIGYDNAVKMCEIAAREMQIAPEEVLVSSTGRIGVQLPLDIIEAGIVKAVAALSEDGGDVAAHAIMTTDTKPKSHAVEVELSGGKVRIGGMTKGAGMIAPRLTVPHATMLCYITTDAAVDNRLLAEFAGSGADSSFNCINIDGDMSTNDTLILMANGLAGVTVKAGTEDAAVFYRALLALLQQLAREMVMDGEGVSKFVTINVRNAASATDAYQCAYAVSNSLLCKTAWFGCDPNWGRIIAAIGYSGAEFIPENVKLDYNDKPVVRHAMDAGTPERELAELLRERDFTVNIDLGAGDADFTMWTNDITYEYVKINAEYHT